MKDREKRMRREVQTRKEQVKEAKHKKQKTEKMGGGEQKETRKRERRNIGNKDMMTGEGGKDKGEETR